MDNIVILKVDMSKPLATPHKHAIPELIIRSIKRYKLGQPHQTIQISSQPIITNIQTLQFPTKPHKSRHQIQLISRKIQLFEVWQGVDLDRLDFVAGGGK
jgi:hypothetical protein